MTQPLLPGVTDDYRGLFGHSDVLPQDDRPMLISTQQLPLGIRDDIRDRSTVSLQLLGQLNLIASVRHTVHQDSAFRRAWGNCRYLNNYVIIHKPRLHWSSNPDSINLWSRTEFQSTNGCGMDQSRLNLNWWAFTLEVNPGECGLNVD